MGRRRTKKKRIPWKWILLVLVLVGLVHEGRFYIPRHIRPPKGTEPVEIMMETTSYCHCRRCCSYKWFLFIPYQKTGFMHYRLKHVGVTSSGATVRPGSIAADTSIFPYGTVMYVPGYGYGKVEDTGGAIKGQHIDLYRPNHWYARKWGVQKKRVTVWLPKGKAWSFTPPEKEAGPASNMLPVDALISNAMNLFQSILSNSVPAEASAGATNGVAPANATEQMPLP